MKSVGTEGPNTPTPLQMQGKSRRKGRPPGSENETICRNIDQRSYQRLRITDDTSMARNVGRGPCHLSALPIISSCFRSSFLYHFISGIRQVTDQRGNFLRRQWGGNGDLQLANPTFGIFVHGTVSDLPLTDTLLMALSHKSSLHKQEFGCPLSRGGTPGYLQRRLDSRKAAVEAYCSNPESTRIQRSILSFDRYQYSL